MAVGAVPPPAPALVASVVSDAAALAALRPAWAALWQADPQADAFAHPAWFCHWWAHFGHGAQRAALVANTGGEWVPLPGDGWALHVVVVHDARGALRAVWPLVRLAAASFRTVSGAILATPVNSHALRSGCVGPGFDAGVAAVIAQRLAADLQWQLLLLDGLPQADGRAGLLAAALGAQRLQSVSQAGWTHSHLAIRQSWQAMIDGHARGFRKHLWQSDRALAQLGALQVERLVAPGAAGFAALAAIERRSWKARQGEVVADDPRLAAHYGGLCALHEDGLHGELWLLRVAGELAAYYLCLRDGRALYTLKTSYDERYAPSSRHSPSQVLLGRLIEASWHDGLQAIDFVGEMPFVARWADSHPAFTHQLLRRPPLTRWVNAVRRALPALAA